MKPKTLLPWCIGKYSGHGYSHYLYIKSANQLEEYPYIASIIPKHEEWTPQDCKEDAEFIVNCCNNYHKSIQLIKELLPHANIDNELMNKVLDFLNEQ